jgi:cytochrome c-type biogenesis protein CcmH/NrfG
MIVAYVFLALLFLLALAFALRPFFRSQPQRFPDSPRPDELRSELEVLTTQAKDAEGEERKRLLAMMVRLERQLSEMGNEKPVPRRLNPVTMAATALSLVLLGGALWAYTVPRLPGEPVITMRDEALQLGSLQRQAERSGAARDWLAFANKAYELQDFDRAVQGYMRVLELEPRNVVAVRRIGILLVMSGRPVEGAHALELATRAQPDVPEGWLHLGNANFQLGRPAEAIEAWETYLRVGGENSVHLANLIQIAKDRQNTRP